MAKFRVRNKGWVWVWEGWLDYKLVCKSANLPLTGLMLVLVGLADQPTTTSNLISTNPQQTTHSSTSFFIILVVWTGIIIPVPTLKKEVGWSEVCCWVG